MIPPNPAPPEAEVGKPAPSVVFYRENGRPVRLADFRGKIVVVEFTSLDCPPCRTLAPKLEKLAEDYLPRNIVFLVISTDPPENLAKIAALRRPSDPTLLLQDAYNPDRSKMALSQFHIGGVPSLFVIDETGKFASRQIQDGIRRLQQRLEWALKKRI